MFASLGLPGLSGFVGEFLIFKGTFALTSWAAVLSVMGLLTTGLFLLTILQRVWNGPLDAKWNGFSDLTRGERCLVFPAIALMFILGLCPQLVLGVVNSTVLQLVEGLKL
jgi:NADH-quinone oxidoreductase subunit M